MDRAAANPWLISTLLHGAALALVAALLSLLPQEPPALTMKLVQKAGPVRSGPAEPAARTLLPPRRQASAGPAPVLPAAASSPSPAPLAATAAPSLPVPVAASLDELLGGAGPAAPSTPAWSAAAGEGYNPPPLPPPGLAPPQGARWNLTIQVPPGGGYALSWSGLDSGHPDLDRWLEAYLRRVAFPSSADGQAYQTTWTLSLEPGRPR